MNIDLNGVWENVYCSAEIFIFCKQKLIEHALEIFLVGGWVGEPLAQNIHIIKILPRIKILKINH